MINKKIELLLPAGSLANLKAAIANGADAVYLGLDKFNAREFATNFSKKDLIEAIKICKSNNVKLYLTMNTLIKNNEITDFFNDLSYAYKEGIDSVIIQDPSFIDIIKKSFSGLNIHLSTQAGIMNSYHANIFDSVDRIVLARELFKESLKSIRKNYNKELEIFVHGALCVCVSGSCIFSSFLGGRSGNRGKCAQPCRKKYNKCFYLSTKELSLIDEIPEIISIGINSLKVEGRMRTPYYVATVADVYRKAIDSYYSGMFNVSPESKKRLESAFSREFTKGVFANENVFNRLNSEGFSNVKRQSYEVMTDDLKIDKRESRLFLPEIKKKVSAGKKLLVRVYNKKDAISASESGADIVYYDMLSKDFQEIKKSIKVSLYGITPRIMFDSDIPIIEKEIKKKNPEGLLVGNLGILNLKLKLPIHLDYNSNCFNDINLDYLESMNVLPIISPELSFKELIEFKNKNFIVFSHGKIRLMTLAHKLPKGKLTDEKGFSFYVEPIHNGSEILNEKELGFFNKIKNLTTEGINQIYIDTDKNVKDIVSIYRQILDGKTIDVSKIKNDYVLGWSEKGVL